MLRTVPWGAPSGEIPRNQLRRLLGQNEPGDHTDVQLSDSVISGPVAASDMYEAGDTVRFRSQTFDVVCCRVEKREDSRNVVSENWVPPAGCDWEGDVWPSSVRNQEVPGESSAQMGTVCPEVGVALGSPVSPSVDGGHGMVQRRPRRLFLIGIVPKCLCPTACKKTMIP